jgi:hypothetical protein
MIRVVTREDFTTPNPKPFPKLMQHTDGTITLFFDSRVGTHILDPNCTMTRDSLYRYNSGIEMSDYSDYNEEITIKNK